MGYPTSAAATARSRAATGLSNVDDAWISDVLSRPAAVSDDWISELMSKSVEEITAPAEIVEDWIDDFLKKPLGEVTERLPSELVDELPASTGKAPWAGPGLAALGRASNVLGAWQLANWTARELHEWNQQRQLANAKSAAAEWTWPDPADFQEGSFVTICSDTEIQGGPYGGASICGVFGSHNIDEDTYVSYGSGSYPEGVLIDVVSWHLVERIDTTDNTLPAVRARYRLLPPDRIPIGEEPPNTQFDPRWWPQQSSSGSPGEGPAPKAPSMLDPESLPVTSPQPRGTPAPPSYGTIPYIPEDETRPPDQRSRRANTWPPPDNWPKPVVPPWDEPDWRKRRRQIPDWWWRRLPLPAPVPEAPGGGDKPPTWGEKPPGKGTKERKSQLLSKWWWFALRGALQVTEANDLVDAWWEALPNRYRTPGASAAEKWQDLYRNWDQVSVEKGIENTIINAVEDAVIGAVEGAIQKAGRQGTRPDWANNPTKPEFEEELAQRVNDLVEGPIRDAVPPGLEWPGT